MIEKIISGGQTGADRGGLDAAIEMGIMHGGYCPRGRLAEDGRIPEFYDLVELLSPDYPTRTRANINNSDGTVVFTYGRPSGGSALTLDLCNRLKKPSLHVDLRSTHGDDRAVLRVADWLLLCRENDKPIRVLNVAGSRESKASGIQEVVRRVLVSVLRLEKLGARDEP